MSVAAAAAIDVPDRQTSFIAKILPLRMMIDRNAPLPCRRQGITKSSLATLNSLLGSVQIILNRGRIDPAQSTRRFQLRRFALFLLHAQAFPHVVGLSIRSTEVEQSRVTNSACPAN
jgi:hypothetical protein